MNIMIGTPMYGGVCYGNFMTSIFGLHEILVQNGHAMSLKFLYNESLIQRARNLIANSFLQDPDSDILLFIDADIEFDPVEVYEMLKLDKDIIGAVVPLKAINYEGVKLANFFRHNTVDLPYFGGYFNINYDIDEVENDILAHRPFKVDRIGAAVLSIKKEVLKNMSTTCETFKPNSPLYHSTTRLFDFFPVKIENDQLMSEDYSFCNKAREIGYDVYATSYPIIGHSGTHQFKGNLNYEINLKKQYEQYENELQKSKKT
jgi:hypothetical protein